MYNITSMSNIPKSQDFIDYYKQYKDKIYAYFLYRLSFDKKTAEDLTSEVFLKAFKHFKRFDQSRSFQSWIFAISRNHLINHYIRSKKETSLAEAEYLIYREDTKVSDILELERVIKILNSMEVRYKEALILRFIDGLSNSEIAEVLNKDEGAIRTQISRGLKELRKILTR